MDPIKFYNIKFPVEKRKKLSLQAEDLSDSEDCVDGAVLSGRRARHLDKTPVVVLLAWMGGQDSVVSKYSAIHENRGYEIHLV